MTGFVSARAAETVIVRALGPASARALPGPRIAGLPQQGPAGASQSYTHVQGAASAEWIVNHNLGFRPSVEIFDTGGAEIDGAVLHVTPNQTRISFAVPVAGSARLT